jgi:hypothetical protein
MTTKKQSAEPTNKREVEALQKWFTDRGIDINE